jgi:formylglycine-generating enzyme required for sulfatase activity
MKIYITVVSIVFFLMMSIHRDQFLLATDEIDAESSDQVLKTISMVDSPEVTAQKTCNSRFLFTMSTHDIIQSKTQMGLTQPTYYRNPKDGYEMILIPAGEAIFGTGPDEPYFQGSLTDMEKPQFRANIPEFYIGIYSVTNEQYFKFVRETGHHPPEQSAAGIPIWKDGKYPEEKAKHPVVCVSWHDARAYCQWAGLRLPTDLQWEKAARGIDGRIYPWGNEWDEKKCRNFNNKGSETTCAVDDYPDGVSVFGIFNMSGNVWEWCEDWYESRAYERYERNDLSPPATGQSKLLRGGSWHGDTPIPFRCAARISRDPSDTAPWTGFRCVREH